MLKLFVSCFRLVQTPRTSLQIKLAKKFIFLGNQHCQGSSDSQRNLFKGDEAHHSVTNTKQKERVSGNISNKHPSINIQGFV
ncbi:hypothetical protein CXB51_010686 [Gossypium anomalum]|uniref:Uncharacterized protein n=1 Tax=Gossypium anomalum TaxID=47600 RepID=A0A8J5Z217_9ROSI|nr:hypothetical protein CXB51_010686 [Gossypium anomalum]